jgi:hypothetical protein
MSRLQAVVIAVIAAVVGVAVLPPYLDMRKVNDAVMDLELIADAALRYEFSTAKQCAAPDALLRDPGDAGWRGPYLTSAAALATPWGGRYVFDLNRRLVGIGATERDVPAKYRLGGDSELSMPIGPDPAWWPDHAAGS